MRMLSFVAFVVGITLAVPAFAGTASFADGKGEWKSTNCMAPTPPANLPKDPETPANDLNARVMLHNQYVEIAKSYMTCLGREAHNDATAVSQMIVGEAQTLIQKTQDQIAASASWAKADK